MLKKPLPSRPILLSVLVTVAGSLVTGFGDMSSSEEFSKLLIGYLFAGGSCIVQAFYFLLVELTGAEKGLGEF